MDTDTLTHTVEAIHRGEARAIAQALSCVENGEPGVDALVDAIYPLTGTAWRIGLTGPPGAGKSTLANRLIETFRNEGQTVGVVAVDPTSPFTGGALLGDRVRMDRHYTDDGVFIRSLASRGAAGGLTEPVDAIADVLDAAGFDIVLLETVGVGQGEVDIAHSADSTVVVLVPESGDAVQAMKAGLMEIADIFCVNKSDHPEVERLTEALRSAVELSSNPSSDAGWQPPIVSTTATDREKISALLDALDQHYDYLKRSSMWTTRRSERLRYRVRRLITTAWEREFWTPERKKKLDRAVEAVDDTNHTPYALARELMDG